MEYRSGISSALNLSSKQDIRFDAKNGVLTLKGKVRSVEQRRAAEHLGQNTAHVQQVVNQVKVNL